MLEEASEAHEAGEAVEEVVEDKVSGISMILKIV